MGNSREPGEIYSEKTELIFYERSRLNENGLRRDDVEPQLGRCDALKVGCFCEKREDLAPWERQDHGDMKIMHHVLFQADIRFLHTRSLGWGESLFAKNIFTANPTNLSSSNKSRLSNLLVKDTTRGKLSPKGPASTDDHHIHEGDTLWESGWYLANSSPQAIRKLTKIFRLEPLLRSQL